MKTAYIFSGQGSQYVGMGLDLYRQNEAFATIFDSADDILKFKLSKCIFEGSDSDLKQTNIAQLAVFVYSIAYLKSLENSLPQGVAGHSLGEYSALVAAQAIKFEDCLLLIQERAKAMQEASKTLPGKMAAVLGLEDHIVENVCKEIYDTSSQKMNMLKIPIFIDKNSSKIDKKLSHNKRSDSLKMVFLANYNCPGQAVISGTIDGVNEASKVLTKLGSKRIIEIKVSGAFHTIMMKPAQQRLKTAINNINISIPICPIYQNYDAKPTIEPQKIKDNLIKQIISPVLWVQTIKNMSKDGFTNFEEIGPGKVLSNLIKRIVV